MTLKVLHASNSSEWSGGTSQMLALAEGLRGLGWEAWIACRPGTELSKQSMARDLPTFHAAMREDYDLVSAWRLADFIRREKIDVVHAHHNRAHAVCLLAKLFLSLGGRAPILVVSRRVSFPPGRNPFSRWKFRSGLIDAIVAVADAVKEVLVASGVDARHVTVIRSGVDLGRFAPKAPDPELRRKLGIPEGVPVIGKVANASPWKGQTVFLEAAALLLRRRPAHFLLAGRDTNSGWIKDELRRLGIEKQTTLAGFRADVPDILSCLDVSVNAAVRGEGLSGALRESLSMSIPVVASDIAGNRELLGEAAGRFLFPPGDSAALAERLEWVLDHRPQAREAALAWRARAQAGFSLEQALQKTDALYRGLLAGRPPTVD